VRPWLIVAYTVPGRVIGLDGRMPWHRPADLKHFKAATLGHPVVMGRTTWTSIGRPLPGRRNLVLSRDPAFTAAGAEVHASLDAALAACADGPVPFIIGGGQVYAEALARDLPERLIVTEIALDTPGDARFPAIDEARWRETGRRTDGDCTFRVLDRV
jgi:dihydrofolate reductase